MQLQSDPEVNCFLSCRASHIFQLRTENANGSWLKNFEKKYGSEAYQVLDEFEKFDDNVVAVVGLEKCEPSMKNGRMTNGTILLLTGELFNT